MTSLFRNAKPLPVASAARRRLEVLFEVVSANPWRVTVSCTGMVVVAVLEGISVVTLLPLLAIALDKGASDRHGITVFFDKMVNSIGLSPSIESFLLLIVGIVLVKTAVNMATALQMSSSMADIIKEYRSNLLRSFLNARWEYFVSQPAGRLANAIGQETQRAGRLYTELCDVLSCGFQVVVYSVVAFMISWQVTVSALTVGLLMFVVLTGFVEKSRQASRNLTDLMASFTGRLIDSLSGIKPLKAMGLVRQLEPLLTFEVAGLRSVAVRMLFFKQTLVAAQEAVRVIAVAIMLYFILRFTEQSIELLAVIVVLFMRTVTVINNFQKEWNSVAISEVPYEYIKDLTEFADSNSEHGGGTKLPTLERGIRFENVSFNYGDNDVLQNVNLFMSAGKFTCVMGPSGAGKTTLLDLVIGLIRPRVGRVMLDEQALDEVDQQAWRHSIGYVPQEIFLFHDTLLRNVTLGDPELTEDVVEIALKSAGAWNFVQELPEGVHTVVGERGGRLSGGQRQRISIARALVRKPRLLILDEASSALDAATEAAIADELRQLTPRVTILAITHRTTLVEHCDITFHLQDGRLVDRGTASAYSLS